MKTKLLAAATLALALVCLWQWRELRATRIQLLDQERAWKAEANDREAQERRVVALEEQQDGLKAEAASLSSLVAAFRSAEAKYASNSGTVVQPQAGDIGSKALDAETEEGIFGKGLSGMVSKLMKDPAMKDMMRAQQKAVMNTMYGGLAKDLNLTPEQNEKLNELLLDQQMKALDHAQSLFAKDTNASITTLASAIGDEQKQSNESIKALLGVEKFAQFEDYQKTMGERMQLNQFKQQLDGGQSPLQDEQVKQLMAVIRQERDLAPPAISGDLNQNPAKLEKMFSGDFLEKQMQWQEQMNQRVLDRAGQILTPEQLKAYTDFQSQQLNLQRLGLRMARDMFGNKDAPGELLKPPQEVPGPK